MLHFLNPIIQTSGVLLSKLPVVGYGPSVESVLESGKAAMDNGGSLADLSEKVDDFGGGAFHITQKGAIYLTLIAIIIAGVALVFSNAGNRSDRKGNLVWVIIGAVIIFSGAGALIFLSTIGAGLFG